MGADASKSRLVCEDESSAGGSKSVGGPITVSHVAYQDTLSYTLRTFRIARPSDEAWRQNHDPQVRPACCNQSASLIHRNIGANDILRQCHFVCNLTISVPVVHIGTLITLGGSNRDSHRMWAAIVHLV